MHNFSVRPLYDSLNINFRNNFETSEIFLDVLLPFSMKKWECDM